MGGDRLAGRGGKQGMINLRSQRVIHSEASKWAKSSPLRLARGSDNARRNPALSVSVRALSTKEQSASGGFRRSGRSRPSRRRFGIGFQHGTTLYGVRRSDVSGQDSDRKVQFAIRTTQDHVVDALEAIQRIQQLRPEPAAHDPGIDRARDRLPLGPLPAARLPSLRDARLLPVRQVVLRCTVASAASGVLSMQSLLYAIGLGAGSIPTAAAINWVLKDGLGQFGGVMFASIVNNRYDGRPQALARRKAPRLSLDLARGSSRSSRRFFPAYFLPMASLGKRRQNISSVSSASEPRVRASTTRSRSERTCRPHRKGWLAGDRVVHHWNGAG
ncbi:hypothetical protein PINS_up023612 [Pythium insidiosum]|nr:hypothetical protein PINS_up023612 [Pythium insidiosum]